MNGKWLGTVILAMLAWSATSTAAAAQDSRDVGIALEVSHQIERYSQFTIFDNVTGTVDNGIVTLTGKVTMPYKANDIGRRAGEISGVREVRTGSTSCRCRSMTTSCGGESRARSTATRPSGSTRAMANPPIHIIVEGGHVTLTGVVNSNVDRMLARSLAVGFGEFSVTNDLRTDAEMRSN